MKCTKCNYTSFDYLDTCKRCGADLRDTRTLLQIIAVSPEDQAPTAPSEPPPQAAAHDFEASETGEELSLGPAAASLQEEEEEEILEGLDFDGTFDDLVERTSYADQPSAQEQTDAAAPVEDEDLEIEPVTEEEAEEEEEELLDLDFGDLFEEKKE